MNLKHILYVSAASLFLVNSTYTPAERPKYTKKKNGSHKKNIIFDLNGVLFTTQTPLIALLENMGIASYLRKKLFALLNKIELHDNSHAPVFDTNGVTPLPELMYQWLIGSQSNDHILQRIQYAIAEHPEWFSYPFEQRLMSYMVGTIFKPERFAYSQKMCDGAYQCIQQYKKAGYNVYVLSNWDRESFVHMRNTHTAFFDLFDGIVISGDVGCAKPNPAIYTLLLQTYNLNPADCYFIDDQLCNVEGARLCGIQSIVCPQLHGLLTTQTDFTALQEYLTV